MKIKRGRSEKEVEFLLMMKETMTDLKPVSELPRNKVEHRHTPVLPSAFFLLKNPPRGCKQRANK